MRRIFCIQTSTIERDPTKRTLCERFDGSIVGIQRYILSKAVTQSIGEAGDGSEILVVLVVFTTETFFAILSIHGNENCYEALERYRVVCTESYE